MADQQNPGAQGGQAGQAQGGNRGGRNNNRRGGNHNARGQHRTRHQHAGLSMIHVQGGNVRRGNVQFIDNRNRGGFRGRGRGGNRGGGQIAGRDGQRQIENGPNRDNRLNQNPSLEEIAIALRMAPQHMFVEEFHRREREYATNQEFNRQRQEYEAAQAARRADDRGIADAANVNQRGAGQNGEEMQS